MKRQDYTLTSIAVNDKLSKLDCNCLYKYEDAAMDDMER